MTAHLMTKEVDAGDILRVLRFPIAPEETAASLHDKVLNHIPKLVTLLAEDLRLNSWRPIVSGDMWQRKALRQKDLVALMRIVDPADNTEVRRKVRAFSHPEKPGPYLQLHGFKFWYLPGKA